MSVLNAGNIGNSPVTFTAAEGTEASSFLPNWENGKFNGTLQTIRPASPQAEYLFARK
ncbi:MAG: hypothetical protein V8Q65_02345 [Bacteroidaceae bacterium]